VPAVWLPIREVAQLPSKAPYSKRFEEAVGQACESASVRQVARHMRMAASTVRAIDFRCLERWEARRRRPPLRQMGVDEIYRGKKGKFLTVTCNLETAEPLWFGRERKKETLDDFPAARTAPVRSPSKSRCGPISTAFHGRPQSRRTYVDRHDFRQEDDQGARIAGEQAG
jgi:transposase